VTDRRADRRADRRERGQRAERAAVEHLKALGFDIDGTNVRVGALEIDVVARKDDLVVVGEVRTRGKTAWTSALASVDGKKQRYLVRAAERLYRERFAKEPTPPRLRFDVFAVELADDGSTHVEHIIGAFTG